MGSDHDIDKDIEKTKDDVSEEEEEEERDNWGSPVEFILSCLGYAVGLGNVWRFPYMCFENGGGAFLIPYFIMLTFVGLPVFFIELITGQYSGSGPMTVWAASPLFVGVGLGMLIISFIGSIYYNMIIGWSMYYMFGSFSKVLPWEGCNHDFNTEYCYSKKEALPCENDGGIWFNQTCYNQTYLYQFNDTETVCNDTARLNCWDQYYNPEIERLNNYSKQFRSASEEYFNFRMLARSDTMEETGTLKWDLVLVLLLAWIVCFFCLIRGIKSTGKVVYFTATFPYLVLIILFFRGVTLPGAAEGIKFYIIPKFEQLAKPKVWVDAAGQIFFSLSVGMGGLMTYASYNKFHNNVYRDTLIVTIGNCLTSFFAGFVIFSILGFMAHELGTTVDNVAKSGSGLAFIAYPEVVTRLPPGQLWAFLFFFMLLTLGLDSQFAGLEAILTGLVDTFPKLKKHKIWVTLALCILMFLLGLTMCTNAGIYWEELMGYYSSGWSLVLMGLAEGIIFPWVYGGKRLIDDVEAMVGFRLKIHWWICWMFITPVLLIAILIFNMIEFTPLSFGDYVIPPWGQALGWMMAMWSVVVIPICAVYKIWQSYKLPEYDGLNFGQRIIKLTKPNEDWKPSIEKYGKGGKTSAVDLPVKPNYDNPAYNPSTADNSIINDTRF